MAEVISDNRDSRFVKSPNLINSVKPIVDSAIAESDNLESFMTVALTGVVSLVVGSLVGSVFKKK